jgi:hypothetical protein
MRLPRLTAEHAMGPATGTYIRVATAGRSSDASASRQQLAPQMLAAQQPSAADVAAAQALLQLHPCDPLLTCWGTGANSRQYVCCNPATSNCAVGANGVPTCGPRIVTNTLSLTT